MQTTADGHHVPVPRPRPEVAALLAAMTAGSLSSAAVAEDPPPWSGIALVSASHAGAADLSGGAGTVEVGELFGEARLHWQPRAGIRVGLGLGGGAHRYHSAELRSRFAIDDDLAEAWLRVPATVMMSEHWGVTTLSSFGVAGDGSAPPADGRRYTIQAGALLVRDRDLLVSVGVVVSSRLERSPSVFPLVTAYWRFAEDWRLTVIDEIDNASRLTWRLDPALDLGLLVDVRFFEFALDHDLPGEAAVLRDERIIVGLEAEWRPLRGEVLAVRPFAGAAIARRLSVFDEQGGELFDGIARGGFTAGCTIRSDF